MFASLITVSTGDVSSPAAACSLVSDCLISHKPLCLECFLVPWRGVVAWTWWSSDWCGTYVQILRTLTVFVCLFFFLISVFGNCQWEIQILSPSEHGQDQGPNTDHLGETRPGMPQGPVGKKQVVIFTVPSLVGFLCWVPMPDATVLWAENNDIWLLTWKEIYLFACLFIEIGFHHVAQAGLVHEIFLASHQGINRAGNSEGDASPFFPSFCCLQPFLAYPIL